MQIHELNEYPLNPSDGDWLIVDTGKDTAKVNGGRFAYKTDMDVMQKEIANVITNNNGYKIDTLWTGTMSTDGDSATLSSPLSNYDYIDIYTYFFGVSQVYTTDASEGDLFIRNQNIGDDTDSKFLVVGELKLVLSAQAVALEFNHRWRWSGSSSSSAAMTSNDSEMRITKIVGRKCVVNQTDAEVEDIRVGADGTVYPSAGDAVRDQVGGLDTRLSRYETIFTADVDQSVSNWLDEHPEATTTVQDGSITTAKLGDIAYLKANPIYYGADRTGRIDSSQAIADCIEANKGRAIWFSSGTYLISEPIKTPHTANERVSIDFGGAVIKPIAEMDCLVDIGGYTPLESGEAGYIKTFYKDGVLLNNNSYSDKGIYVETYYKDAFIDTMNVKGFQIGIQIGNDASVPSDSQISNCLISYDDMTNGSTGIDYKGTDNKLVDSRIYGFQYSVRLDAGALFARNVHNLPKGLITQDNSYIDIVENSAFFYCTKDNLWIDNCYCDTYGNFVMLDSSMHNTGFNLHMTNNMMYSYLSGFNQVFVNLSNHGQSTSPPCRLHLVGNALYARNPRTKSAGVKFSSANNLQTTLNTAFSYIKGNLIVPSGILSNDSFSSGDLFSAVEVVSQYWRGNHSDTNRWLKICSIPVTKDGQYINLDIIQHYSIARRIKLFGTIVASGSDNAHRYYISHEIPDEFPHDVGLKTELDENLGAYVASVYVRNPSNTLASNLTVNSLGSNIVLCDPIPQALRKAPVSEAETFAPDIVIYDSTAS